MLKDDLSFGVKTINEFRELGIFYADWGSMSLREGENIWITKSGIEKYADDGFIADNNQLVTDKKVKLSGEYPIHKAILDRFPRYNSIIHTHSPFHSAFGNIFPNYNFDRPYLEMRKVLDKRGEADSFILPTIPNSFSKEELSEKICTILEGNFAVLVKDHGLYVAGESISQARTYVLGINHLMMQVSLEAQISKKLFKV